MKREHTHIPVIAVDGPSGTGKGTICRILAQWLDFHFLDSGALYRLVGLAARRRGIPLDNDGQVAALTRSIKIEFKVIDLHADARVLLDGDDVSEEIRSEAAGRDASVVAVLPSVRTALLDSQRGFRKAPGLVADGRDMGTVVFPDADLKVFLTASAEERARRRYNQLKDKGADVSLEALLAELNERDNRDRQRTVAPLVPAPEATILDTTALSIEQVVAQVQALWLHVARRHAYS
jgi:cytidylate kinase